MTLKVISDTVAPTLAGLQESLGIDVKWQITSTILTSETTPTIVRKTQIRALIVALGLGVIGSAMIIAIVDSFLLRRADRRHPKAAAPTDIPVLSPEVTTATTNDLEPRRRTRATRAGRLGLQGEPRSIVSVNGSIDGDLDRMDDGTPARRSG